MKVHLLRKIYEKTNALQRENTCSGNLVPRSFPPESEDSGIDLELKNVHSYMKFNSTLNII